jgi:hypothetical protein
MHRLRLVALDEVGDVAVAAQQLLELLVADPREHGGIRDLVAVQVQDRQDRTVRLGIQELVRVPRGRERAGLRFAVADDGRDDQVGVVEGSPVGMGKGIAELATFVDRSRRLGSDVARNPTRERELLEEALQALLVLRDVRVDLAVGALEPGVRDQARAAVPRTGDVENREVVARITRFRCT